MSRSPRADAARALHQVCEYNRTIDWVSQNHPLWLSSPLSQELVYGTLRHFYSLQNQVIHTLSKPLKRKDSILLYLMLVGAYQLRYLSVPDHAAINETVNACRDVKRPWARSLLNGVLRHLQRTSPEQQTEQSFELPAWLAEALDKQYADTATALKASTLERAPMTLRINPLRGSSAEYEAELQAAGIAFSRTGLPCALTLDAPMPSQELPGWAEGRVAVQDLGAQWVAATLLEYSFPQDASLSQDSGAQDTGPQDAGPQHDKPLRLLDACAAPGGKLFHALESAPARLEAHALELKPERLATTQAMAKRLGHTATWIQGDATTDVWWDGTPYDLILLDAPCSGTGTLRRHPEIKVLLAPEDIQRHADTQIQMLLNLWHMLAPGGTLLYCTCSVLQAENDAVVAAFIEDQAVSLEKLSLPHGEATRYGWQMLPTDPLTDGFYMSLMRKPADA